jgi:hypothetical protein
MAVIGFKFSEKHEGLLYWIRSSRLAGHKLTVNIFMQHEY